MLAAISRLRWDNRQMRGGSNGVLGGMRRNGLDVPEEQKHRILAGLNAHFQNCVITPSVTLGDQSDQTPYLERRLPAR
jgi:hypothetical protein